MKNKKENFKRISENRVSKMLSLFSQLTNLTNSSFYEYSDEDIDKMFCEIEKEMKKTKDVLIKANNKTLKMKKKNFEL